MTLRIHDFVLHIYSMPSMILETATVYTTRPPRERYTTCTARVHSAQARLETASDIHSPFWATWTIVGDSSAIHGAHHTSSLLLCMYDPHLSRKVGVDVKLIRSGLFCRSLVETFTDYSTHPHVSAANNGLAPTRSTRGNTDQCFLSWTRC
jgi:hypothetical protein